MMGDTRNGINGVDQHVGRMLGLHRKVKGLTRIDVSQRVSIPPRQLKKFEAGQQRVSPKLLRDLCITLGIKPGDLFDSLSETGSYYQTRTRFHREIEQ